jgi:hypothetical protein
MEIPMQRASANLQEKLIAAAPAPSELSVERAPQAVWPVVRFILGSPMQCSRLRGVATVVAGGISCVAVGGCLAGIGIFIGQLVTSLKNADEAGFDRSFLALCMLLAAALVAKTSSEYCVRSVGQLKRAHLNKRLQSMWGCAAAAGLCFVLEPHARSGTSAARTSTSSTACHLQHHHAPYKMRTAASAATSAKCLASSSTCWRFL